MNERINPAIASKANTKPTVPKELDFSFSTFTITTC